MSPLVRILLAVAGATLLVAAALFAILRAALGWSLSQRTLAAAPLLGASVLAAHIPVLQVRTAQLVPVRSRPVTRSLNG